MVNDTVVPLSDSPRPDRSTQTARLTRSLFSLPAGAINPLGH